MLMKILLLCLLLAICIADAARKYDYIIVGAGSAGSAAAYALDQLGDKRVLLLERARDETDNPSLRFHSVNSLFAANSTDKQTRQYIKTYEPQLNGRNLDNVAALAAGGGTQVAGAAYLRANRYDFDVWNQRYNLTRVWTYDNLLDCYIHMENFSNPLNPNDTISDLRGRNGVIRVLKQDNEHPNYVHMKQAFQHVLNLTFTRDLNAHEPARGLGVFDRSLGHDPEQPYRSGYYEGYLKQRLTQNDNRIELVLGASVSHFEMRYDHRTDLYRATALYYTNSRNEQIKVRLSRKTKLIISAGQQQTSKLLIHSGIGNCAELAALDAPCYINRAGVSLNLRDHAYVAFNYQLPGLLSVESPFLIALTTSPIRAHYLGKAVDTKISLHIFPTSPPTLFMIADNFNQNNTGRLKINYKEAYRDPLIQLNYTVDDENGRNDDPQYWVWVFRKCREVLQQYKEISGLQANEVSPGFGRVPLDADDATILAYIRGAMSTEWHTSGTNRLGNVNDPNAVVDEKDLRIIGTSNVHVMDGSVMPDAVRSQPFVTITAMALHAIELIEDNKICIH